MKTSLLHTLITTAALTLGSIAAEAPAEKPAPAPERPLVQLAILLDTSGSMEGLISQAKQQLWQIVNEFIEARQDGVAPRVEVALYQYGNDGLKAKQGFVQQLSLLTQDLDQLSEKLFALKTDGGSEFCGWVIRDAVKNLAWDASPKVYKAIFIAGNEPFTQGPVNHAKACKSAVGRGIIVNTIHCGSEAEGVQGKWKDGAALADGRFLVIDQNAEIANVSAPQDKEIAGLNDKLNATYVAFGAAGAEGRRRQVAQDANTHAAPAPATVTAARAKTKASANYLNEEWDLVDALKANKVALKDLKDEQLPAELRKIEPAKRAGWVAKKQTEREELQSRLLKVSAERDAYVAGEMKSKSKAVTLDNAVSQAVREQAAKKAFVFEKE